MTCDVCNHDVENPIHNYLLLHADNTYEGNFADDYVTNHSTHAKAKYDVMMCAECYSVYLSKFCKPGLSERYAIPKYIPDEQVKRFILKVIEKATAYDKDKG